VAIPGGKIPFGRSKNKKNDNIRMGINFLGRTWTGLIWLRMGTNGELVLTWYRNFVSHKMCGTF
jgi:hypothetical protein